MISCIYTITNKINGKIYIGYTNNFLRRKKHHCNCLDAGIHKNCHLQQAWNKYGENNFVFEILEECEEQFLVSQEHYWCTILNTHNRNYGYNILPTNPEGRPKKASKETCIKISNKNKGRKLSEQQLERLRAPRGPMNKATVEKVRIAREKTYKDRGWVISEEGKEKLRKLFKGRKPSENTIIGAKKKNQEIFEKLGYHPIAEFKKNDVKPITQLNLKNEVVCFYNSIKEASEKTGLNKSGICRAAKKNKTAGGYKWKYT